MRIIIRKTADMTPAFEEYIEKKLAALSKFIMPFEKDGQVEMALEISRATQHHRKGGVFKVAADLHLPQKVLHAEEYADDIRKGIDGVRNTLHIEIEKYRTKKISKGGSREGK